MSNSKPVNISSPQPTLPAFLEEGAPRSFGQSITGSPRSFRAVTPPIANIPPRGGTPASSSPAGLSVGFPPNNGSPAFSSRRGSNVSARPARNAETPIDLENVPDEEKARVLRRHLVSRQERKNGNDRRSPPGSDFENAAGLRVRASESSLGSAAQIAGPSHAQPREDSEPFPVPYNAPGGDITHSIYKWHADQQRQARPRAVSFTAPPKPSVDPAFEHIHEPGGFRRHYVLRRANEQGAEDPQVVNNFIEFLYLFGHFAGEDLEEDEDEEDEMAYQEAQAAARVEEGLEPTEEPSSSVQRRYKSLKGAPSEHEPLLTRASSKRSISKTMRRRRSSVGPHGDATVTQAVLMLLKAFVGTGILFLGKAFLNGGLLFSTLTLVFIALVSLYSFLLLVKTKTVVPGSFGDIGGTLYGDWMRYAILTSIAISQLGFVSAYTIFVAENLQAFILAVTNCTRNVPVHFLIFAQLIVILPASLVRNLAKLSTTALVADAFILAGLVYLFSSEIQLIAQRGFAKVEMFNQKDFPLLIGTAVFSFEGIGLVIPITDAMREPHKFPAVLSGVMFFLMVLFGGAGALAYLTFGADIQTVVITNLDPDSKFVQAVQFLYSLAILLSIPLQLFPAIRIMENGIFTRSGKDNIKVKWEKNLFRCCVVLFCTGVSWAGAKDLDKFVALVGSFACVPLCYVYPPMLHYKARAKTQQAKAADILLFLFGIAAAVYTTVQTIRLMAAPESGGPAFGKCDPIP